MAESGKGCPAGDEETASHMRECQAFSGHSDNHGKEEQQPISHLLLVDRVGKGALNSFKNPSKVLV